MSDEKLLFTADDARKNLDNVCPVLSDICRIIKNLSKEGSCQVTWFIEKASEKFCEQLVANLSKLGYVINVNKHKDDECDIADIELIIQW